MKSKRLREKNAPEGGRNREKSSLWSRIPLIHYILQKFESFRKNENEVLCILEIGFPSAISSILCFSSLLMTELFTVFVVKDILSKEAFKVTIIIISLLLFAPLKGVSKGIESIISYSMTIPIFKLFQIDYDNNSSQNIEHNPLSTLVPVSVLSMPLLVTNRWLRSYNVLYLTCVIIACLLLYCFVYFALEKRKSSIVFLPPLSSRLVRLLIASVPGIFAMGKLDIIRRVSIIRGHLKYLVLVSLVSLLLQFLLTFSLLRLISDDIFFILLPFSIVKSLECLYSEYFLGGNVHLTDCFHANIQQVSITVDGQSVNVSPVSTTDPISGSLMASNVELMASKIRKSSTWNPTKGELFKDVYESKRIREEDLQSNLLLRASMNDEEEQNVLGEEEELDVGEKKQWWKKVFGTASFLQKIKEQKQKRDVELLSFALMKGNFDKKSIHDTPSIFSPPFFLKYQQNIEKKSTDAVEDASSERAMSSKTRSDVRKRRNRSKNNNEYDDLGGKKNGRKKDSKESSWDGLLDERSLRDEERSVEQSFSMEGDGEDEYEEDDEEEEEEEEEEDEEEEGYDENEMETMAKIFSNSFIIQDLPQTSHNSVQKFPSVTGMRNTLPYVHTPRSVNEVAHSFSFRIPKKKSVRSNHTTSFAYGSFVSNGIMKLNLLSSDDEEEVQATYIAKDESEHKDVFVKREGQQENDNVESDEAQQRLATKAMGSLMREESSKRKMVRSLSVSSRGQSPLGRQESKRTVRRIVSSKEASSEKKGSGKKRGKKVKDRQNEYVDVASITEKSGDKEERQQCLLDEYEHCSYNDIWGIDSQHEEIQRKDSSPALDSLAFLEPPPNQEPPVAIPKYSQYLFQSHYSNPQWTFFSNVSPINPPPPLPSTSLATGRDITTPIQPWKIHSFGITQSSQKILPNIISTMMDLMYIEFLILQLGWIETVPPYGPSLTAYKQSLSFVRAYFYMIRMFSEGFSIAVGSLMSCLLAMNNIVLSRKIFRLSLSIGVIFCVLFSSFLFTIVTFHEKNNAGLAFVGTSNILVQLESSYESIIRLATLDYNSQSSGGTRNIEEFTRLPEEALNFQKSLHIENWTILLIVIATFFSLNSIALAAIRSMNRMLQSLKFSIISYYLIAIPLSLFHFAGIISLQSVWIPAIIGSVVHFLLMMKFISKLDWNKYASLLPKTYRLKKKSTSNNKEETLPNQVIKTDVEIEP